MKDMLIILLIILALIALFGDGGLEVSPSLAPALQFSPALDLKSDIHYTPTHIDTNIEQQTVIMPVSAASSGGSTTVQPNPIDAPGGACETFILVGEHIYNGPDGYGACFVENEQGQRFFINQRGVRWYMGDRQEGP